MTRVDIHPVIRILKKTVAKLPVPVVGVFAESRDPYIVLISCLLSLRTRDAVTSAASGRLFKLAGTAGKLAKLSIPEIQNAIYPVCFYRVKARTLKALAQDLLDRFDGRVPDTMDDLLSLKGVGRKTANLTLTLGHRKPGICVDVHVHRISNRLGYLRTKTPDESELALRRKLPTEYWMIYNDLLVPYGQHLCTPISPWCSKCPLSSFCARRGVGTSR